MRAWGDPSLELQPEAELCEDCDRPCEGTIIKGLCEDCIDQMHLTPEMWLAIWLENQQAQRADVEKGGE